MFSWLSVPHEYANELRDVPFTRKEINKLWKRFNHLDKGGDGFLTVKRLESLPELTMNPLADRIVETLFGDVSVVTFPAFVRFLSPFASKASRQDKLRFAFQIYDVDRDGKISKHDLHSVLKSMVGTSLESSTVLEIVDQTMQEYDIDGDQCLSLDEFKRSIYDCEIESVFSIDI
jgi:serine/threonine-protein phosphatase 2B regulatory subunit